MRSFSVEGRLWKVAAAILDKHRTAEANKNSEAFSGIFETWDALATVIHGVQRDPIPPWASLRQRFECNLMRASAPGLMDYRKRVPNPRGT